MAALVSRLFVRRQKEVEALRPYLFGSVVFHESRSVLNERVRGDEINTHPPVNFQNKTTHYQMSGVFIVVKVDEVDEGVF